MRVKGFSLISVFEALYICMQFRVKGSGNCIVSIGSVKALFLLKTDYFIYEVKFI